MKSQVKCTTYGFLVTLESLKQFHTSAAMEATLRQMHYCDRQAVSRGNGSSQTTLTDRACPPGGVNPGFSSSSAKALPSPCAKAAGRGTRKSRAIRKAVPGVLMESRDKVRLGIFWVQEQHGPAQPALVIQTQPGTTGVPRAEPIQKNLAKTFGGCILMRSSSFRHEPDTSGLVKDRNAQKLKTSVCKGTQTHFPELTA